jgi:hypothetical protein
MRPLAAVALSFVANLAILCGCVYLSGTLGGPLTVAAACLLGLTIGCVMGSTFKTAAPRPVAIGAFAAALILWLPVVVVTYGFALLGVPLLVAYAACVQAGARMVRPAMSTLPRSS